MVGDQDLGARLRALRLRAGLSQSQLADRSGVPKPRLSRYENGHILPSLRSIQALADALETSPAQLIGDGRRPLDVFVQTLQERGIQPRSVREAQRLAHRLADQLGGQARADR